MLLFGGGAADTARSLPLRGGGVKQEMPETVPATNGVKMGDL